MDQIQTETIRLYIVEEQEIYREIYKYILSPGTSIELLEVTGNSDADILKEAVAKFSPDVLLLSTRKLEENIVDKLEQIRMEYPGTGMVLFLISCSSQDIELLRRLALKGDGGIAIFLKQSLDQIDQLSRTITAVHQGQVILDPQLASFMFAGKPECPFLKQLTTRELEILSLLSQGYTNAAIAQTLYIDIKTVEHHLNSLYSKLKADSDFNNRHLRVSAAKLYLETMGEPYYKDNSLIPAAASRK